MVGGGVGAREGATMNAYSLIYLLESSIRPQVKISTNSRMDKRTGKFYP